MYILFFNICNKPTREELVTSFPQESRRSEMLSNSLRFIWGAKSGLYTQADWLQSSEPSPDPPASSPGSPRELTFASISSRTQSPSCPGSSVLSHRERAAEPGGEAGVVRPSPSAICPTSLPSPLNTHVGNFTYQTTPPTTPPQE